LLPAVALALAGRAGARLAPGLDLAAGRSSMLRLVMALPDPQAGTVKVLGVDLSGVLSHPSVTSASVA
jgi:ABC-type thiamine transport system ATPase subunit